MIETAYPACVACFRERSLQDHHIEPRSAFGSTRLREREDPQNKVTLCAREHDDIHAKRLFLVSNSNGSVSFVRRSIADLFVNWELSCRNYIGGSTEDFQVKEEIHNERTKQALLKLGLHPLVADMTSSHGDEGKIDIGGDHA